MIRLRVPALAAAVLLALAGCGSDDVEQARDEVRERAAEARAEFREQRERVRKRIEAVLEDIEQAIPEAPRTLPAGRSQGQTAPTEIGRFMTRVLENIDRYWTETLTSSGLPAPEVRYVWVDPGTQVATRCGAVANDGSAFYCPADDTIYVAQQFAADLLQGVLQGLPGQNAGYGRAAGDFAVAYVIAHEYAHNVQQELGIFTRLRGSQARPFELQADCMAGLWANSVYEQGLLEPGDLEEALNTSLAVGDFEVGSEEHHGTPPERREALLAGYESGEPAVCRQFVPEV